MSRSLMGSFGVMRRPEPADLMLFAAIAWWRERSLRLRGRDLANLAGAALIGIFINQLSFVYAIKLTTATTVALLLGIERLNSRFWMAAALAFSGAALVALGSGTGVSAQLWGDLLGFAASATWAWYTVSVSPLLHRYSTVRVSAVAFTIGTIPLFFVGLPQLMRQDYHQPATIWLLLAFAIVGPLVIANLLWFGGISRVGPSRASVFANAQPFLAAVFSLLILNEPLGRLQVVGGFLIACAILISRIPMRAQAEAVPT